MLGALALVGAGYAFAALLALIGHKHNRSHDLRKEQSRCHADIQ